MGADWFEARAVAHSLGLARVTDPETVTLDAAAHRSLAADLLALAPLPGYSSSAMDGWVVSGPGPWTVGEPIATGDPVPPALAPGTARPIGTGGALPRGASTVVRLERGTERDGILEGSAVEGSDIRLVGEEAAERDVLLSAGTVLTAARLALAASAGHDELVVRRRPRVDLFVLGNEVVPRGIPEPGHVRDVFAPSIAAAVDRLGGLIGQSTEVHDDHDATAEAIASSTADLVIVTGGSSRGVADHTRAAVRAGGGSLLVDGVAMRPGHPAMIGSRATGAPVVCLPGNPLAGLVAFFSFADPVLRGLLGSRPPQLGVVVAGVELGGAGSGVRLIACTLVDGRAIPVDFHGPGMTRGIALADCVVVVPPAGAEAGAPVALLTLL